MRKIERIKIDDREVQIKELRVGDCLELFDDLEHLEIGIVKKHFERITDLPFEDFKKLAPSEIRELYEAFKKANSDFFGFAAAMGIGNLLETIKAELRKTFGDQFAGLLRQAMSTALDTASASSGSPRPSTPRLAGKS